MTLGEFMQLQADFANAGRDIHEATSGPRQIREAAFSTMAKEVQRLGNEYAALKASMGQEAPTDRETEYERIWRAEAVRLLKANAALRAQVKTLEGGDGNE